MIDLSTLESAMVSVLVAISFIIGIIGGFYAGGHHQRIIIDLEKRKEVKK